MKSLLLRLHMYLDNLFVAVITHQTWRLLQRRGRALGWSLGQATGRNLCFCSLSKERAAVWKTDENGERKNERGFCCDKMGLPQLQRSRARILSEESGAVMRQGWAELNWGGGAVWSFSLSPCQTSGRDPEKHSLQSRVNAGRLLLQKTGPSCSPKSLIPNILVCHRREIQHSSFCLKECFWSQLQGQPAHHSKSASFCIAQKCKFNWHEGRTREGSEV